MGASIEFSKLTVQYETQGVLDSVDFVADAGQFVSVVGLSGCGKTTVLRAIANLLGSEAVLDGKVLLDGNEQVDSTLEISMCFQRSFLLPWLSAKGNIALNQRIHPGTKNESLVQKLLVDVGLSNHGHKFPNELSGGMQQRAALAREFLRNPDVLLLDEPFSSLDCITREQLNDYLLSFWRQSKPTVVLVTHDPEEAVYVSDQVLLLSKGAFSNPTHIDLERPRSLAVKQSSKFRSYVECLVDEMRQATS